MNYELQIKKRKNSGYTLIETMIAVSLFIIIVSIGMGALLNAGLLHNKSKDMRSILDNLSFVMDDMSRNLRTGTTYDCITTGSTIPASAVATSGTSCGGIAFASSNPTTQLAFFIGPNLSDSNKSSIFEETNGDLSTKVQLTPDEVSIDQANVFSVLGAEAPNPDGTGDHQQPFVTIRLVGHITYKNVITSFSLQTSVSQRQIDI
jgi:type II secretory pathway pseudopilin PulG